MADWIKKLNDILTINGRELLEHAGCISSRIAESYASEQLDKFKENLRLKEKAESLDELERDLKRIDRKNLH